MNNRSMIVMSIFSMLLVLGGVLTACATPTLSPSQTAEQFWSAVLAHDVGAAKSFVTVDMPNQIAMIDAQWEGGEVTFGTVQLKQQQAFVETSLRFQADNITISSFNTHLVKQDNGWLVDYKATQESLQRVKKQYSLNKLINSLQDLGKEFSGHVDEAIKELDRTVPEIKADVESLGSAVADEMKRAINKLTPEIKQNIQHLSETLDEVFSNGANDNKQENNDKSDDDNGSNGETISPEGRLI